MPRRIRIPRGKYCQVSPLSLDGPLSPHLPLSGMWGLSQKTLVCLLVAGFFSAVLLLIANPTTSPPHFTPLPEVRWGIVGCGDVTERKSGPALSLIPGSRLVMVMRRNATLAADYAQRHNVPRWTSEARELIDDPEVNAVYVATPPRFHIQYALMAAAAGKPAYVEKPMGVSYEEGLRAVEGFKRRGLPLFVAYYRRTLPYFLQVKALVDGGSIGGVRAVTVVHHKTASKHDAAWARTLQGGEGGSGVGLSLHNPSLKWRVDPSVGGAGGYFRDLGSHQLDLLQFFLGDIVSISGTAGNQAGLYPAADSVSGEFKFASGVLGTGSWCFAVGKSAEQEKGEIVGTEGRIIFHFFTSNKMQLVNDTGSFDVEVPNPQFVQQPLLQTVVDELLGKGKCPSSGETAVKASRLMDVVTRNSKWP